MLRRRGHTGGGVTSEISLLERRGSAYRAVSTFRPFGPQNASFLEIYLKETNQMPNAQTFHYEV